MTASAPSLTAMAMSDTCKIPFLKSSAAWHGHMAMCACTCSSVLHSSMVQATWPVFTVVVHWHEGTHSVHPWVTK